jgi:signal transduction histidine kinase
LATDCHGRQLSWTTGERMRFARWLTPLWPGLTQLWFAGDWWGLALGCGFAWLVNLAVVTTVVWTEWLDPWSRIGVWVLLLLVWTASVTLSFRQLLGHKPEQAAKAAEDLFRSAQREYLSGNWIKVEQLLTQLLEVNGKDVDAHLLMVSLLRRTGQLSEASERLRRLTAMDGADKWDDEIARERRSLDELFSDLQNGELQTNSDENPDQQSADESGADETDPAESINPPAEGNDEKPSAEAT